MKFIAGILLALFSITTQSDPSTLLRLETTSLQYVGAFRVPNTVSNGDTFAGGGFGAAFNAVTGGMFVSSYNLKIAEITIPTPVNSSVLTDLPTASFLQPFADPVEGHNNEATFNYGGGISGFVVAGGKLVGATQIYYDSSNEQRVSHYTHSLTLSQASFVGFASVWQALRTGYVSGFTTTVSTPWQAKLGGPVLTGNCCIPIVSRTSFGPAAFAYDPAQVAKDALVPASPLLYYDEAHQTLGLYTNQTVANEVYNQSTEIHGMVQIEGTRTLLYIGRNGIGIPCYGQGTSDPAKHGTIDPVNGPMCYDLNQFGKGTHAWPYRYQIWAYDLNDLAAVKAGTKQPWEVVPYGVWPLTLPIPGKEMRGGGVAYDPQKQTLYFAAMQADFGPQDESYRPIFHAFKLNIGAVPPIPPIPPIPPVPTDPTVADLLAQIAQLEAQLKVVTAQRDAATISESAAKARLAVIGNEASAALARNLTLKPNSRLPKWAVDAFTKIVDLAKQ